MGVVKMQKTNLDAFLPLRLPAWLLNDLKQTAEAEARRDGSTRNVSLTARRALAAYIHAFDEASKVVQDANAR